MMAPQRWAKHSPAAAVGVEAMHCHKRAAHLALHNSLRALLAGVLDLRMRGHFGSAAQRAVHLAPGTCFADVVLNHLGAILQKASAAKRAQRLVFLWRPALRRATLAGGRHKAEHLHGAELWVASARLRHKLSCICWRETACPCARAPGPKATAARTAGRRLQSAGLQIQANRSTRALGLHVLVLERAAEPGAPVAEGISHEPLELATEPVAKRANRARLQQVQTEAIGCGADLWQADLAVPRAVDLVRDKVHGQVPVPSGPPCELEPVHDISEGGAVRDVKAEQDNVGGPEVGAG
mmetsp:Transcript_13163/g.33602  ORF Transcript_13163/g.33602 Transcript_13163/m.33602 type:complete len:296 (+) Transcript_13163:639-1526(+)